MKPPDEKRNSLGNIARFGGMAFQMGIIISLFTYAGHWIDQKTRTETPWFTLIFSLAGIASSLYLVIKDITRS